MAATIGFVLLYVTYHLQKWVSAKEERNKWILIATVIMAIFMILYASLKNYPMDYVDGQLLVDPQKMALNSWSAGGQLLGFGLGWYCEHKWVKFTVEGTISDKLGRFLLGGIGILLFYYLAAPMLELIFPTNIAYFGQHFVFALFIVYVYPLIFSRKKK